MARYKVIMQMPGILKQEEINRAIC